MKEMRTATYLLSPYRIPTTLDGSFHKLEIDLHKVVDVHPGPPIQARFGVERIAQLDHVLAHLRHEQAIRLAQSPSQSIDPWWAYDSRLEPITVLKRCRLQNLVSGPVQVNLRKTRNLLDIVNVGPDSRVELAVRPGLPVRNDARAGEAN